jgi:hypothetical protein
LQQLICRLRAFSWNNINIHDWKDIIIHLLITRDFANDLSLYEVAGWYLLDVSPMYVGLGYRHCESYYSV